MALDIPYRKFTHLQTRRLILRRWQESDVAPFIEMCSDPAVMEYFMAPLAAEQSIALIERIEETIERYGFGFWAAELKATGEFIGFVGISVPAFRLPCEPCIEVGWRVAKRFWGQGLAPEGAVAALEYGFAHFGLKEIVAITYVGNMKSRRVMEKIGMTHSLGEEFDFDLIPEGHPLRRQIIYRIKPHQIIQN